NYVRGVNDTSGSIDDNPFRGAPGSMDLVGEDGFISTNVADAWYNRQQYNGGGSLSSPANSNNPRGYPVRSPITGGYLAVNSTNDSTHGIQIDLAQTDVPVAWFVEQPGAASFEAVPNGAGYGTNPIPGVSADGTDPNARDNTLRVLQNTNTNTASPDQCTIFDNPLTLAPVGAIVNYGVGLSQIDKSDLRHGLVTGRRLNGENLVFATRDSGSGTRNGFANGICLDPSWAMGDNVGSRQSSSSNDNLGPNWQPTNLGGSSRMDAVVLDSRLGIGHTGAERLNRYKTSNNGNGGLDVLAIRNDIFGSPAATYNRPFIDNLLDNSADNGYNVIGPGNIASIGDRTAMSGPAQMENQAAADYLNNIAASVAAFSELPGADETLFSPGEFLAFRFIPNGTADFVAGPNGACDLVPAPNFNQDLQEFVRGASALGEDEFEFFDFTAAGDVPSRQTGITYLDGVPGGTSYIDESGDTVTYGTGLSQRNKISGDFNADLERNADDIADIVAAWEERDGGASWTPPSGDAGPSGDFVIDIVGDFNGDGSFDLLDVRYFMDGLALDTSTGNLDRGDAFEDADNASASGNLFGTSLATGAAYTAGASAADVAGNGSTPGFHPIGADGVIDAADLDSILLQYAELADGSLDWSNTNDAATPTRTGSRRDLSADVNGDLIVNIADLCEALDFLDTDYGDVNLDGSADAADLAIINANSGQAGGWADGDITGDGFVDAADAAAFGTDPCDGGGTNDRLCGDVNGDGGIDGSDFFAWVSAFGAQDLVPCDVNNDGSCDGSDFFAWVSFFGSPAGDPGDCQPLP
ncbi:MAG: hypothetical protein AAGF47_06635, partial [Planctomycetota bacterium]